MPFAGMLPEVLYPLPDLNDGAFHKGIMLNTIAAIKEGRNPLDFWFPSWLAGFPLFHYYQPIPYLVLATVYLLLLGKVEALVVYRAVNMLMVCLIPLGNYKGLRKLGWTSDRAAWGAFLSLLIASDVYGYDYDSFTWWGWGLFAQACAAPFLPLALGYGYQAVKGQRRTLGSALILSCAFLTHILYGYIAAISLAILPVMGLAPREWPRRVWSLSRFYVQTILLILFFIVPLAVNIDYHFKSYYDEAQKFDSLGANKVLTLLFSGQLLDLKRLPVFTGLTAVGFCLCINRWLRRRSDMHGWLAWSFALWILLYFGRTTWGPLMKLLPLSNGLHMERLSNGVHFFAIWLAAFAFSELARFAMSFNNRGFRLGCWLLAIGLLMPMLAERSRYMVRNAVTVKSEQARFKKDVVALQPVLDVLRREPSQRIHVGHTGNWGNDYLVGFIKMFHYLSGAAYENMGNMPFSWSLLTDFQAFFKAHKRASYDLYDVHYLLTDQKNIQPPEARLLIQSGKHYLYRIPPDGGRFSIVAVPLAIAGDKETTWYHTMSWTQSTWAESKAHARLVFDRAIPATMPVYRMVDELHYLLPETNEIRHVLQRPLLFDAPAEPPVQGRLSDSFVTREEAGVTVTLEKPGYVLFKSTFHPNWHAYVDEVLVPTMILTPGMIGIQVPAGTHRLEMSYEPGALKLILLIVGVAGAIAVDLLRRKRFRPVAPAKEQ